MYWNLVYLGTWLSYMPDLPTGISYIENKIFAQSWNLITWLSYMHNSSTGLSYTLEFGILKHWTFVYVWFVYWNFVYARFMYWSFVYWSTGLSYIPNFCTGISYIHRWAKIKNFCQMSWIIFFYFLSETISIWTIVHCPLLEPSRQSP